MPKTRYVIDCDKRSSSREEDWNGVDDRLAENEKITKQRIDGYFNFLQNRAEKIVEYIKDKEKKKLWIIGGSYTVFSLVATVMVKILTSQIDNIPSMLALPSIVLFSLFVVGVVLIYTSIIKFILALKADCILATRQLNCLRQSINSVIFSYLETKYPKCLPAERRDHEALEGTILDKNTKYWEFYGCHDKYPLDNLAFRKTYDRKSIYFRSADIYSVVIIAIFTSLLIMTPFGFLMAHIKESESLSAIDGFMLGGISCISLAAFLALVGATVHVEMKRIKKYLEAGQPFEK